MDIPQLVMPAALAAALHGVSGNVAVGRQAEMEERESEREKVTKGRGGGEARMAQRKRARE